MNNLALSSVLNFFLDPYQFNEMILEDELMRNMGGDKEYVSVCPRVVVNTPGQQREECGQHTGKFREAAHRRPWKGLRSCTVTTCKGRGWQPSGTQGSSYSRDTTGAYTWGELPRVYRASWLWPL